MKFQGAIKMQVYHGAVNILGAHIINDGKWHQVISDPRKNMLIDIKNESIEDYQFSMMVMIEGKEIEFHKIAEKSTLIAIKEYKAYSDAEEQFLIPSSDE